MAKVRGIYSTKLSGRVGQVSYKNTVYGNIVTQLPAQVTNPQTRAQQVQRAIYNAVIQSYSQLKNIDDHAFENMRGGRQNMAHFLKLNLKNLRNFIQTEGAIDGLGEEPYGMVPKRAACVPFTAALQVSDGTLFYNGPQPSFVNNNNMEITTKMNVSETTTVGDFLDTMGVVAGEQLTLLGVKIMEVGSSGIGRWVQRSTMEYGYVVVKADVDRSKLLTAGVELSTVFSKMYNVDITIPESSVLNTATIALRQDSDHATYAGAVIKSAYVNGSWQRSTAFLTQNLAPNISDQFGYAWDSVVESYNVSTARILNNATT